MNRPVRKIGTKRLPYCLLGIFTALLLPSRGLAASFSAGDVLVGGRPGYAFEGGNAYVDRYSSQGAFIEHLATLNGGHPRDIVLIARDIVVGDEDHLTRIDPQGTVSFVPNSFMEKFVGSLAVDNAGNVYVGEALGSGVAKIAISSGMRSEYIFPTYNPPNFGPAILAMDMLPDQCTMLYASGGPAVQQFDFCSAKPLPDFGAIPSGFVLSIRILAKGDLLAGSTSGVYRFNSAGQITGTYVAGTHALRISLVPGEDAIWIGANPGAVIEKIDLASGGLLAGPIPVLVPENQQIAPGFAFNPEALLVVGDRRVAQTAAAAGQRRRAVRK